MCYFYCQAVNRRKDKINPEDVYVILEILIIASAKGTRVGSSVEFIIRKM